MSVTWSDGSTIRLPPRTERQVVVAVLVLAWLLAVAPIHDFVQRIGVRAESVAVVTIVHFVVCTAGVLLAWAWIASRTQSEAYWIGIEASLGEPNGAEERLQSLYRRSVLSPTVRAHVLLSLANVRAESGHVEEALDLIEMVQRSGVFAVSRHAATRRDVELVRARYLIFLGRLEDADSILSSVTLGPEFDDNGHHECVATFADLRSDDPTRLSAGQQRMTSVDRRLHYVRTRTVLWGMAHFARVRLGLPVDAGDRVRAFAAPATKRDFENLTAHWPAFARFVDEQLALEQARTR